MVDNAVYNAPLAGVTIVATGGRLATTVSVAAFDHDEGYADRHYRDRDGCGDPSADERHGAAEHEDNRDCQESEISRRCLYGLHISFRLLSSVRLPRAVELVPSGARGGMRRRGGRARARARPRR